MLDSGRYKALDGPKDLSMAEKKHSELAQRRPKPEGSRPTLDARSKQEFQVCFFPHMVLTSRPLSQKARRGSEVSLGAKPRLAAPSLGGCPQKSAGRICVAGSKGDTKKPVVRRSGYFLVV